MTLAITAVFISAKFQERIPPRPKVKHLLDVLDERLREVVTKNDILETELRILAALEFDISHPNAVFFLERYRKLIGLEVPGTEEAKFCKQIAQLTRSFLKYTLQISKLLSV